MFAPLAAAGQLALIDGDGVVDATRAPQLEVLSAAGHTPGHLAVALRSAVAAEAAASAVYVGDALHLPAQVAHPGWSPSNFDCCGWPARRAFRAWPWRLQAQCALHSLGGFSTGWNRQSAVTTRKELLGRIADQGALLLSPHFPAPGMGRVARVGSGAFEYAPLAA